MVLVQCRQLAQLSDWGPRSQDRVWVCQHTVHEEELNPPSPTLGEVVSPFCILSHIQP